MISIKTSMPNQKELGEQQLDNDPGLQLPEPLPPDFDDVPEPDPDLPDEPLSTLPEADTSKTWGLRAPHRLEPTSELQSQAPLPPPPAITAVTQIPATEQNILRPSDLLPIEQRFERAAADDVVKYSEAIQLIRSLKAMGLSPTDEREARQAFEKYRNVFTEVALTEMNEFFKNDVPRLHRATETHEVAFARTPRDGQVNRTATSTLTWEPVTKNKDGTAVDDLAGYKVLIGSTSGNYSRAIDVNDPSATGYIVEDLGPGSWYFVVKAYDTSKNESDPSNEVSKVIQ